MDMYIGPKGGSQVNIAGVYKLSPGQPTTKGCADASKVQGNAMLIFSVKYRWPWWLFGRQDVKAAVFDVKEGQDGHFLVPSSDTRTP
jgi:hypothetical protein